MIAIKKVLVATDYSDVAGAALRYGRVIASTFDAELHVVNVVETFFTLSGIEGYITDAASLSLDIEQSARRQLEAIVTDEDRTRLRAKGVLLNSDRPAIAVVAYAKDASVDLIIVGTHGRGGMSHLLLGSVAERIVRLAPCPVLTVRHPEHEFIGPDTP